MAKLDESHAGQEIAVGVGETIEVCLPENPTTGYRWHVAWDGDQLGEPLDDAFTAADGAPGAGGTHCWRFRVAHPGAARLSFQARRPWETAGGRAVVYHLRVPR
jgi:inhibitor of cysteine peptidase